MQNPPWSSSNGLSKTEFALFLAAKRRIGLLTDPRLPNKTLEEAIEANNGSAATTHNAVFLHVAWWYGFLISSPPESFPENRKACYEDTMKLLLEHGASPEIPENLIGSLAKIERTNHIILATLKPTIDSIYASTKKRSAEKMLAIFSLRDNIAPTPTAPPHVATALKLTNQLPSELQCLLAILYCREQQYLAGIQHSAANDVNSMHLAADCKPILERLRLLPPPTTNAHPNKPEEYTCTCSIS